MSTSAEFWSWFHSNEERLFDQCETADIWSEIDERLAVFDPELAWEMGPLEAGKMYFAVSPDLREELLSLARELVSVAYTSSRWEFRLGRQRRPWSDFLGLLNEEHPELGMQDADLSSWRHVAFRVPGSDRLDVVFEAGKNLKMSEEDVDSLGTLVAIGLLSELVVMERIDSIEVVEKLESRFECKAKPASWLPYAFGMKPL